MMQSTYDPCLLYTDKEDKAFGVVGLQTDDTLIVCNERFAEREEKQLKAAKFMAKDREVLTPDTPLKFNGGVITQHSDGTVSLTQEKQCENLRLVKTVLSDMPGTRGKVRKAATAKDQYVAQRARGAYVATMSQPEASFDLSFAAQITSPKEEDAKALNKRLQWQMDNKTRGLKFVPLDKDSLQIVAFTDASFANNPDLSSQIGYIIALTDKDNKANLIHWSSVKCKRVTRSVLASELYGMTLGFDVSAAIKGTVNSIFKDKDIPLVICTDSRSLYQCLTKLGTTQEKRLMIDVMALRQSYERREIAEIKWIDGESNPADSMTKAKPSQALKDLIDNNRINIKVTEWVERD
ncbi:hypothetical protein DID88_005175 [Monilinia fructigena]|nr:hypothetical protein DID88_005175 [Monilinia fructigena]